MKIRIVLEIDEKDLRILEAKGAMLVENPHKGPTLTERKEMGRRGATWIINEYIKRYKDWYYEKKYENPPFVD